MTNKQNPQSNFNIVIRWLNYSRNIQKRKYYNASQLMRLFRSDIKIDTSLLNSISERAFSRHINSAAEIMPTFIKVKTGFPVKTKYIMLLPDDVKKYHENSLHITNNKTILPRNFHHRLRSYKTPESKSSTEDTKSSTSDTVYSEDLLTEDSEIANTVTTESSNIGQSGINDNQPTNSSIILNMTKSDLSSSLCFLWVNPELHKLLKRRSMN